MVLSPWIQFLILNAILVSPAAVEVTSAVSPEAGWSEWEECSGGCGLSYTSRSRPRPEGPDWGTLGRYYTRAERRDPRIREGLTREWETKLCPSHPCTYCLIPYTGDPQKAGNLLFRHHSDQLKLFSPSDTCRPPAIDPRTLDTEQNYLFIQMSEDDTNSLYRKLPARVGKDLVGDEEVTDEDIDLIDDDDIDDDVISAEPADLDLTNDDDTDDDDAEEGEVDYYQEEEGEEELDDDDLLYQLIFGEESDDDVDDDVEDYEEEEEEENEDEDAEDEEDGDEAEEEDDDNDDEEEDDDNDNAGSDAGDNNDDVSDSDSDDSGVNDDVTDQEDASDADGDDEGQGHVGSDDDDDVTPIGRPKSITDDVIAWFKDASFRIRKHVIKFLYKIRIFTARRKPNYAGFSEKCWHQDFITSLYKGPTCTVERIKHRIFPWRKIAGVLLLSVSVPALLWTLSRKYSVPPGSVPGRLRDAALSVYTSVSGYRVTSQKRQQRKKYRRPRTSSINITLSVRKNRLVPVFVAGDGQIPEF